MAELTASRTLVKSSPELWAECSDAASLGRHLGAFGEIRILRLEPETAVAWEGEDVRGTVTLESSGWGTRVVLTAQTSTNAEEPVPVAAAVPPPAVQAPATEAPAVEAPVVDASAAEDETVEAPTEDAPGQLADDAHNEPEAIEPGPAPRRGLFGRLFGFWRRPDAVELEPAHPGEAAQAEQARAAPDALAAEETAPAEEVKAQKEVPAAEEVRAQDQAPADGTPPPSEVLVGALDSLGQAHRRPFSYG